MTTPADDLAAERAFEASLAGRAVPDEAAPLAAFTEAVRMSATRPGRPNAALAELLVTGSLTTQQSPSPRADRERPRMKILPLLAAKLTAGGGLAKAAVGAGVALVALTGGVAVAAPSDLFGTVSESEELQQEQEQEQEQEQASDLDESGDDTATDTTSTDVGTSTGDASGTSTDVGDAAAEDASTGAADAAGTPTVIDETTWAEGPAEGQDFGAWVSEGARLGYVDGEIVSREAHERNDARRLEREKAARSVTDPAPAPVADEDDPSEQVDQPETQVSEGASADGGTGGGKGPAGNGKGQGKK